MLYTDKDTFLLSSYTWWIAFSNNTKISFGTQAISLPAIAQCLFQCQSQAMQSLNSSLAANNKLPPNILLTSSFYVLYISHNLWHRVRVVQTGALKGQQRMRYIDWSSLTFKIELYFLRKKNHIVTQLRPCHPWIPGNVMLNGPFGVVHLACMNLSYRTFPQILLFVL